MNLTIFSVFLIRQFSLSPFLNVGSFDKFQVSKSYFAKSFSSSVFLNSIDTKSAPMMILEYSRFNSFLSTPLSLSGERIGIRHFTYSTHFKSHEWHINHSLVINHCKFINCTNTNRSGGAIFVNSLNIDVNISKSVFNSCLSFKEGGAMYINNVNDIYFDSNSFVACKSASKGQTVFSRSSSKQTFIYTCIKYSGFESSLLSSESISIIGGHQIHKFFNSSFNNVKVASASFYFSDTFSLSLSFFYCTNNSCEFGRNLGLLSHYAFQKSFNNNSKLIVSSGNILFNTGGKLGVVFVGGNHWVITDLFFFNNEKDTPIIKGNHNTISALNCTFDFGSDYYQKFNDIKIFETFNHYDYIGNFKSISDYMTEIKFDEQKMKYPQIPNDLQPSISDKYQNMRSDEEINDLDILVMDEAYVGFLIPLFFIMCFIWIRKRFISTNIGTSSCVSPDYQEWVIPPPFMT